MRTLVAVVAILAMLAACGERPKVLQFKQSTYQGRPDTPAWSNPPFDGNQEAWNNALRTRAQNQNEYHRTDRTN